MSTTETGNKNYSYREFKVNNQGNPSHMGIKGSLAAEDVKLLEKFSHKLTKTYQNNDAFMLSAQNICKETNKKRHF